MRSSEYHSTKQDEDGTEANVQNKGSDDQEDNDNDEKRDEGML